MVASRTRQSAAMRTRGNRMVVQAGLFGKKKAAAPAKPAKKSLFGGKKAAAPAKPAKKSLFGGNKPKPAAKKAKPAKKVNSSGGGLGSAFDVGKLFQTGNERYYEKEASGTNAKGAQKAVGYRGSGQKGSAPDVDAQGNKAKYGGVVYRFGSKYGGNVDEYSPIFLPETRSSTGDTYQPGLLGIATWLVGFVSLLAVGGYAIYTTSALAG